MRPYLGPSVRIKLVWIFVAGDVTYNPEHIAEMESVAYLWRDGAIKIDPGDRLYLQDYRIVAEDFQLILNSPTILQCQELCMSNAHFSFKDYKVLYTVKGINIYYRKEEIDPNSWLQFLEQSGKKPIVYLHQLQRESIDNVLDQLTKAFSSAVSPNAFKIVFVDVDEPLTEFRETNNRSREKLELKKEPLEKGYMLKRYRF
ncbi:hypothetical protein Ddc_23269 [Ditylenchus destructor]|nr:hypothetical protein Ddc_23269 [Ditylenchus destructor]